MNLGKDQITVQSIVARNRILKSIEHTPKPVRMMCNSLKMSDALINYHLNALIDSGHVKQSRGKHFGREQFQYQSINMEYYPELLPVKVEKTYPPCNNPFALKHIEHEVVGRVVKLFDHIHAPRMNVKRSVWIGNTLATMTF